MCRSVLSGRPRHWFPALSKRRAGCVVRSSNQTHPEPPNRDTDNYFQGYSGLPIHQSMLKDKIRTNAYRRAINRLGPLLEGRTVLDVGCGTGILSMFAASAGADHVYGVEASDMAGLASKVVRNNDLHNHITIIQGRVEDVKLPVNKVDVIISEWMGYFMLYESMLDSVLVARDRWLAPGGVMMPDSASLMLVGVEREEVRQAKLDFWRDVYGYSMRAMHDAVLEQAYVETVTDSSVVTSTAVLKELDLKTATVADTQFTTDFELTAKRDCMVHALAGFFDVGFNHGSRPLVLSTSPDTPSTHWGQTVLYLDNEVEMRRGQKLKGTIACRKNQHAPRTLDIQLAYSFRSATCKASGSRLYRLD